MSAKRNFSHDPFSVSPLISSRELTDRANELITAGLSIIPVDGKRPTISWTKYQNELPGTGEFNYAGGIALVCGFVSGNVEVIDVDTKNDPTGKLLDRLTDAITELCPDLPAKLVIQSTPSGGCHLIYKCNEIEGNKKLAITKERTALIETRGAGGYIVLSPSPGYEIKNGSLENIPIISTQEREDLFCACRSLNEYFEPVREPKTTRQQGGRLTPLDDFNQRADVVTLLQSHGWKHWRTNGENEHWTRPGKTDGNSASWNESLRSFYCFTSSTILEPARAYSPSALFTFFECNGNFSEAASRLSSMGYGDSQLKVTNNAPDKRHVGGRLFRLTEPTALVRPRKLFDSLWAEGENAFLFAEDGAGKSILSVQIGCSIATGGQVPGFKNEVEAQPVILFDTELSDIQFNNRFPPGGLPQNFKRVTFNEEQQDALIHASIQEIVDEIEITANSFNAKVIILDNLSALASMMDLTKTSDSVKLMGLLNNLKKKGFSILIIDHCRKPQMETEFKAISKHDLQGSKMKSNLVDSAFSIGKSCQGEDVRYIKGIKVRSYEMAYTKTGVATMYLRADPLRFEFANIEPEWSHVNDKGSQANRMSAEGKSQVEIARELNITQQAVSKHLSK